MIRKMEQGQSLILVTILLFAFFAILALVLDGGFLYYMRRNAQNAADSGALAGADDLCKFRIEAQAENVARNYAFNNGVTSVTADATSFFGTSVGGIVEVWTEIEYKSFFARLLGLDTIYPPAHAKAGCAPPQGTSVMPVAWSCRGVIDEFGDPQPGCEVRKVDHESLCTWPEARDKYYIIADSDDIEVDTLCQPDGTVDCDSNGDGDDDIELLSGGDRSWLDLNGGGGGAAELIDWIEGDYENLFVRPHSWVPVQTGVTASVYDSVFDNILGKRVVMPIFDLFCPEGAPPKSGCPPVHTADQTGLGYPDLIIGDDPQDYYHIITFSYWVTICVDSGSHKGCDGRNELNSLLEDAGFTMGEINSLQTMEGCFVDGNAIGIGGEPGQGIDTGVYVIFLME